MNRDNMLAQLKETKEWDILIIGGGASGLGAAVESASRGYKTLLLEQSDFAQGTSSRSTKLIHGGIRYLRQGHISFVREALHERALLLQNAPHLVHAQHFIIPASSTFNLYYSALGIKLYDLLAGSLGIKTSQKLTNDEIRASIPSLDTANIRGGIGFFDGQFDDARLAINLAQTAAEQGGCILNYMQVQNLLKEDGKIIGVQARDLEDNIEYEIRAKAVINATGSFVDSIRKMDDHDVAACITPSQGAHIVLDQSFFPSNSALVIPKTSDGRLIFIIPWHQRVLIGTTETAIDSIPLEPRAREDEIEYLLAHARPYLVKTPSRSDICSTFAGIRALLRQQRSWKSSSWLKREHNILVSPSQMITLAGGKWTTYRKMGEDTINKAAEIANLSSKPSVTSQLRIHGYVNKPENETEWSYYGSDNAQIESLISDAPHLNEKLHPELPCRAIDVQWAVRYEMARKIEDVLSRRTRCLLLAAKQSLSIAPPSRCHHGKRIRKR
jgi:glycerol-3-phosphate dehydrogenase